MEQPENENELELEKTVYLQLFDLKEQRAELPSDEPTRSELESTYDVIESSIKETLQSIRDGRVARAVDDAGGDVDSAPMNDIAEAELRAQEERGHQLEISRDAPDQSGSPTSPTSSSSSNPLSASDPGPSDPESPTSTIGEVPGSSGTHTDKNIPSVLKLPDGRTTVECIACSESITEAYHAPCGCFYDRNCVTKLFDRAMNDEMLFPPKCCTQEIPFELVRNILPPESIQAFEKKSEEFATSNRLYCCNETCSKFLGPAAQAERDKTDIMCDECSAFVCSFCKAESHPTHIPCKNDKETQQVLILGNENGWMACPNCHNLVERTEGCNDMVCRCGYEYCYGCGVKWGMCSHGG